MNNYSTLVDLIIKDEMNGQPSHERILRLGETPNYLKAHANFPDLELAVKASVVAKACFDHGIPTTLLKRLPEIVAKPRSLFRSASHPDDSVVLLTFEVKGVKDLPIIVPLHKDRQVGRGQAFNLVASVYAKEGENPAIKWTREGLLIRKYG